MILINIDRFGYFIFAPLGFIFSSLDIFIGEISYETGDGVRSRGSRGKGLQFGEKRNKLARAQAGCHRKSTTCVDRWTQEETWWDRTAVKDRGKRVSSQTHSNGSTLGVVAAPEEGGWGRGGVACRGSQRESEEQNSGTD